jgi:hypothetical protein
MPTERWPSWRRDLVKACRALTPLLGVVALSVPSMIGCAGPGGWDPPPEPESSASTGRRPPPISGGTLLVTADGETAVAADSDRDVVWVVDLDSTSLLHQVKLQANDEPGRVVEDGAGRVHVLARRGGALISIDPRVGKVLERRAVCPAPRGLAYDPFVDGLHVACADGRLFTFPAGGGKATSVVQLDGDLRDVIMQGSDVYVSTFRSAEILQVASGGKIAQRITLPKETNMGPMAPTTMDPVVAYRTVAVPGGGIAMLHQRGQEEAVSTMPGGYTAMGGPCPNAGIVENAVTIVQPGTAPVVSPPLGMMSLAVDMAVSRDGTQFAVASAAGLPAVPSSVAVFTTSVAQQGGAPCAFPSTPTAISAPATAVAFDATGNVVAQLREPAGLFLGKTGVTLSLPGEDVGDAGHAIFHTATQAGIACASCHPEAGDDGRVWQFQGLGARRTQNIRGGVMARTPFHWNGDIPDMDQLVSQVLVGRMGGEPPTVAATVALGSWMNAQPALPAPPPANAAAVARGKQTFEDPSVGCTTCHNGPQLSDHRLVDVGTGGTFKVPSLIAVGYRAPYLHDGCAATLEDRFSATCSSDQHGHTSQLSAGQIDDMVSYLESL